MVAPKKILELTERFERNHDVYCSSAYNETQARHEFIDPFFVALGWDVDSDCFQETLSSRYAFKRAVNSFP